MLEAMSMYLLDVIPADDVWDAVFHGEYAHDEVARKLGLKCPFCNEALQFKQPFERIVKYPTGSRQHQVKAHFSHYKSGAFDADCEARSVSQEGRNAIREKVEKAKAQRLDLYNQHLWQMFADDHNFTNKMLGNVRKTFGIDWISTNSRIFRIWWGRNIETIMKKIEDEEVLLSIAQIKPLSPMVPVVALNQTTPTTGEVLEKYRAQGVVVTPKTSEGRKTLEASHQDFEKFILQDAEKQAAYFRGLNLKKHMAICAEICLFLGTRTAGYAFRDIFTTSLQALTLSIGHEKNIRGPAVVEVVKELSATEILMTMLGQILGTHWLDQIDQKLHDEISE